MENYICYGCDSITILKIASFNIKNDCIKENKKVNSEILIDIIKNEKIDLLGTQELTKEYEHELKENLNGYKFYGKYRFGSGIFSKNKYNENNIIITNQKVKYHKTIYLPFVPNNIKTFWNCLKKKSFSPRIATIIYFNIENVGKIRMINTHLEPRISSIRKRQLDKIRKIISENNCPTILTGDFNMQLSNKVFMDFLNDMKKYNLKRVEINQSTWIGKNDKKRSIDHIFIPIEWDILSKGTIDNKNISDHNLIYVKTKIK